MNILEKIVRDRRQSLPIDRAIAAQLPPRTAPVVPFFQDKNPFIIAECKKASPAAGSFAIRNCQQVVHDYHRGGARHFSVLTERKYFHGSLQDLYDLKKQFPRCAFLRKDFLFCKEDISHAYRAGADAVLLIAEILTGRQMQILIDEAHRYRMQVLCEAYSLSALRKITSLANPPDAIGINSRNLETFQIQHDQPLRLRPYIPQNIPAVYESGIDNEYLLQIIGNSGFRAALIGEAAVRAKNKAATVRKFTAALRAGARQKPNFFTRLYAGRKNVFVKICGLTNKADVLLAQRARADVAGFVFVPESPRSADEKLLRSIKNISILKVAVVKKITPQIRKLLRGGLIDAVQTYNEKDISASAGNAYLVSTDPLLRALPATLYDAPKTKSCNKGNNIAKKYHRQISGQWLAGGLTPQNVRGLIQKIRPALVDVSSGLEKSIGHKDARKIKSFMREVGRA